MLNQVKGTGINRVVTPNPPAASIMTIDAACTPRSLAENDTTAILPVRAIRVTPIMTMDQTRGALESRPKSSRKNPGASISAIALRPKTVAPARKVLRRNVIPGILREGRTRVTGALASPRLVDTCT